MTRIMDRATCAVGNGMEGNGDSPIGLVAFCRDAIRGVGVDGINDVAGSGAEVGQRWGGSSWKCGVAMVFGKDFFDS